MIFLLGGCRKTDVPDPVSPSDNTGKIQPVGTPQGDIVSKSIGPEGGSISLPDNAVTVTVPAGALAAPAVVGIQPVSNTNPAALGKAYRLTPHGQRFQKPVAIKFSYANASDSVNLPEALGLAYQDSAGVWQFTGGNAVDTVQKTVTYQSTHFSDWSLMRWLVLKPVQAKLGDGEELTLGAFHYVPFKQCNCDEDIIVPIPEGKPYPVGDPQPLDRKYINKWSLAGPGTLIPTTANEAVYKAPASIVAYYTAAVSLQLKSAHTLLLVSNIQLVPAGTFEMRINGGAWKAYSAAAFQLEPGKAGISFISDNERLSMFFPNAKGTYEWDGVYGNHTTGFNYWPNGTATVYESTYEKNVGIYESGGSVRITEYGDVGQYIAGSFTLEPSGYYSATTGKQLGTYNIEARFRLKRAR